MARAIRSIRLNLRETQTEFGARFNVCYPTVSRWEIARTLPNAGTLLLLVSMATTTEQKEILIAALKDSGFPVDHLLSFGVGTPQPTSFLGTLAGSSTASIARASEGSNV